MTYDFSDQTLGELSEIKLMLRDGGSIEVQVDGVPLRCVMGYQLNLEDSSESVPTLMISIGIKKAFVGCGAPHTFRQEKLSSLQPESF